MKGKNDIRQQKNYDTKEGNIREKGHYKSFKGEELIWMKDYSPPIETIFILLKHATGYQKMFHR